MAALGDGVKGYQIGSCVGTLAFGGFSEFACLPARQLLPLPEPSAAAVALLTSGLTASVALEQAAQLRPGQVVLVTAAAGGTGSFAVQLAKLAGCTVIGARSARALARILCAARLFCFSAAAVMCPRALAGLLRSACGIRTT